MSKNLLIQKLNNTQDAFKTLTKSKNDLKKVENDARILANRIALL